MSLRIIGDEFRRINAPPSVFADDVTADRGQAELHRMKLNQHVSLTRDQRITLREMLDVVDDEASGITNPTERDREIMRSIDGVVDRYVQYTPDVTDADTHQRYNRTLERHSGDCEDYAILKYKMARASGIDAEDLAIAYLDSSPGEEGGAHAVLMYRDQNNWWWVSNNNDPNEGELTLATEYFKTRSAPYTVFNEDGAFYNTQFDMTKLDYINGDTAPGIGASAGR